MNLIIKHLLIDMEFFLTRIHALSFTNYTMAQNYAHETRNFAKDLLVELKRFFKLKNNE